jgi:hypothetical protein
MKYEIDELILVVTLLAFLALAATDRIEINIPNENHPHVPEQNQSAAQNYITNPPIAAAATTSTSMFIESKILYPSP